LAEQLNPTDASPGVALFGPAASSPPNDTAENDEPYPWSWDATARRHVGWILALFSVLSLAYAIVLALIPQTFGFPIDDAYIHQQFARNLAEHGEIAFNLGQPSSGDTAPAYVWLLAILRLVLGHGVLAAVVLGVFSSLALAIGVYGLLRSFTGRADLAFWGGLLAVAIAPSVFSAYQGMESPVYGALFVWALWAYGLPRRRWLGITLFAFGVFLRPEFLLCGPFIALERLIAHWRGGRLEWRPLLREVAGAAAIFLVFAGLWSAYCYRLDGHLVPTTYHAKVLLAASGWDDLLTNVVREERWADLPRAMLLRPWTTFAKNAEALLFRNPLLALLLPVAAYYAWHGRRRAGGSAVVLGMLVLALYSPIRSLYDYNAPGLGFQQQRYFVQASALLIVVAAFGFAARARQLGRELDLRRLGPLALLLSLPCFASWLVFVPVGVDNIDDMHVTLGHWLRDNTAPDDLIATNDIGAIAYYSDRRILDLCGLVEPELVDWALAGKGIENYVAAKRPKLVAIFPAWFPGLVRSPALRPIRAIKLENPMVVGGPAMLVYATDWDRFTAIPPDPPPALPVLPTPGS
jgi:arabinofuranosyltransferase